MLLRFKILVYNIKLGLPSIPEYSPDHNFHIFSTYISLNHLFLLFLG